MNLPEQHSSWLNFAKFCMINYPDTKIIIIEKKEDNEIKRQEFIVNDVKAMAFEEIMKKVNFTKNDAVVISDTIRQSYIYGNTGYKGYDGMIDILFSISEHA